jgi:hypothetical protein
VWGDVRAPVESSHGPQAYQASAEDIETRQNAPQIPGGAGALLKAGIMEKRELRPYLLAFTIPTNQNPQGMNSAAETDYARKRPLQAGDDPLPSVPVRGRPVPGTREGELLRAHSVATYRASGLRRTGPGRRGAPRATFPPFR